MSTRLQKLVSMIRFKRLCNKLSDNEFGQFMANASRLCTRKIVMRLLCGQVSAQSTEHNKLINKFCGIILGVIKNRKNEMQQLRASNKSLDQFVPELLGEIASYLDQKAYARFLRCNTSIFIATNSPNTLRSILLMSDVVGNIQLPNYSQVRSLYFGLQDFTKLNEPSSEQKLNHIQEIWIDNAASSEHITNESIKTFISQTMLNLRSVKRLSLGWFRTGSNPTLENFEAFLSSFQNIEALHLVMVDLPPPQNAHGSAAVKFNNLKYLQLLNCTETVEWLRLYGNVETVSIQAAVPIERMHQSLKSSETYLGNMDFSNMKKLAVAGVPLAAIKGIMRSANKVSTITVFQESTQTAQTVGNVTDFVLRTQSTLETLELSVDSSGSIVSAIEYGLFQTRQRYRNKFCIKVTFRKKLDALRCIMYAARITNALENSYIKDYSLRVDYRARNQADRNKMITAVREFVLSSANLKINFLNHRRFIVGNRYPTLAHFQKE